MGQYDKTLGTLLIGVFFNTYLYGLVSYQFARYYGTQMKDPLWIRATVAALFITDTFHSAAVIYMAWDYAVTNYDNPASLAFAAWPYTFTPIGTAIAAIITHNFLGYRIWKLTGKLWVYLVLMAFAIVTFVLGVVCGTQAWIIKELAKLGVLQPQVGAWLALQTAIDVSITAILSITLYHSRTEYRQTNHVINKLIRLSVQTGIFSSLFAMGDLVSFFVSTDTNLYGMFAIPIGRIYTNTLMDTLLARGALKQQLTGTKDLATSVAFRHTTSDETTTSNAIRLTDHGMHASDGTGSTAVDEDARKGGKVGWPVPAA